MPIEEGKPSPPPGDSKKAESNQAVGLRTPKKPTAQAPSLENTTSTTPPAILKTPAKSSVPVNLPATRPQLMRQVFSSSHNTAGGLFSPVKTAINELSLDDNTAADEAINTYNRAREILYAKLADMITKTENFSRQAELAAIKTMMDRLVEIQKELSPEEAKEPAKGKAKNKTKNTVHHQTAPKPLDAEIDALQKDYNTISSQVLNEIKEIGPGFRDLYDDLYAENKPVRGVIPKVLELMAGNDKILHAVRDMYVDRETCGIKSDPAILFAVGSTPEDKITKQKKKNYCIMSFSASSYCPALIAALKSEIEGEEFIADGVKFEILISDRLSQDFQKLITNVLGELNLKAQEKLTSYAQKILSFADPNLKQNDIFKAKLTSCCEGCETCIAQHKDQNEADRLCAERYFVSDQAKGLMFAGIENSQFIRVEGVECFVFTFRPAEEEKISSNKKPSKKDEERVYFNLRSGIVDAFLNRHPKEMTPDMIHATSFQRLFLKTFPPCNACKVNKSMVWALFIALAKLRSELDTEGVKDAVQNIVPPSTLTPKKKCRTLDLKFIRDLVEKTPPSWGKVKGINIATGESNAVRRSLCDAFDQESLETVPFTGQEPDHSSTVKSQDNPSENPPRKDL